MKPNSDKAGDLFVTPMMLEQLRYSGLLEVCTIRKMGFPIRRMFDEFMQRYGCISPSATGIDSLLSDLVQKVRALLSCGSRYMAGFLVSDDVDVQVFSEFPWRSIYMCVFMSVVAPSQRCRCRDARSMVCR